VSVWHRTRHREISPSAAPATHSTIRPTGGLPRITAAARRKRPASAARVILSLSTSLSFPLAPSHVSDCQAKNSLFANSSCPRTSRLVDRVAVAPSGSFDITLGVLRDHNRLVRVLMYAVCPWTCGKLVERPRILY
jgi:hypothetical protein